MNTAIDDNEIFYTYDKAKGIIGVICDNGEVLNISGNIGKRIIRLLQLQEQEKDSEKKGKFKQISNCFGTVRILKGEKYNLSLSTLEELHPFQKLELMKDGVYEFVLVKNFNGASLIESGNEVYISFKNGEKKCVWSRDYHESLGIEKSAYISTYQEYINMMGEDTPLHGFILFKYSDTTICFEQLGLGGEWRFVTIDNIMKTRNTCSIFIKSLPIEI